MTNANGSGSYVTNSALSRDEALLKLPKSVRNYLTYDCPTDYDAVSVLRGFRKLRKRYPHLSVEEYREFFIESTKLKQRSMCDELYGTYPVPHPNGLAILEFESSN